MKSFYARQQAYDFFRMFLAIHIAGDYSENLNVLLRRRLHVLGGLMGEW